MSTVHYIDRKPRPSFARTPGVNFVYDPHPLSAMPPDCPMRDEGPEFNGDDLAGTQMLAWLLVSFAAGVAIGWCVMAVAARVVV